MLSKQHIRKRMLALREQLDKSVQIKAAQEFSRAFSQTPLFAQSQRIAFYLPFDGELDPNFLLQQAQEQGKQCFLPTLLGDVAPDSKPEMAFFSYSPSDSLIRNRYGILEPDPNKGEKCPAESLDLVLVPLVAFDDQHNRLGMGGGYYDKTFAFSRPEQKPYLLGLAYSFQRCAALPVDPWDVGLDGVWGARV